MRFLSLLALLTTASAAPALESRARVNSCGYSSFSADSSNPAAASDCDYLAQVLSQTFDAVIPSNAVNFPFSGSSPYEISYNTCSFSVRSVRGNRAAIGNEDVYDLLRDSLRDGKRGSSVGARGSMKCGDVEVEWKVGRASDGGSTTIGFGKREQ